MLAAVSVRRAATFSLFAVNSRCGRCFFFFGVFFFFFGRVLSMQQLEVLWPKLTSHTHTDSQMNRCESVRTHAHTYTLTCTHKRTSAEIVQNIWKRDALVPLRRYCAPVYRYQTTQISNVNWRAASRLQLAKKRRSHTPSPRLVHFVHFAKYPGTRAMAHWRQTAVGRTNSFDYWATRARMAAGETKRERGNNGVGEMAKFELFPVGKFPLNGIFES